MEDVGSVTSSRPSVNSQVIHSWASVCLPLSGARERIQARNSACEESHQKLTSQSHMPSPVRNLSGHYWLFETVSARSGRKVGTPCECSRQELPRDVLRPQSVCRTSAKGEHASKPLRTRWPAERDRCLSFLSSFVTYRLGRGAGIDDPVPRARTKAGSTITRIGEPAVFQRQTAAADALH